MLQFYFFSVLFNALTGISLVTLKKKDGEPLIEKPAELFDNPNFKLIVGILTGFTGLMKLLSVVPGDTPVFGDFIPFLAGIVGAAVLLFEYNTEKQAVTIQLPQSIEGFLVKGRTAIGYFCIAAAVLHLLFPRVIFF